MDPLALYSRMSRRKLTLLVIGLLILIALGCIDRYAGVLPVDDDWRRYEGKAFEVVRVVDGDTLDLRMGDGDSPTTRVRLWGVDTPELAKPGSNQPAEPWAEESKAYVTDRVQGKRVTLKLQEHRLRGRYGRLLAYVVLPDGSVLNAELIERGFSEHDDRWSHDRSSDYDALERAARQQQRGLWSKAAKIADKNGI